MGRVYTIEPKPGELSGRGVGFYALNGAKIKDLVRVEFDGAGDEGFATCTAVVRDDHGCGLAEQDKNAACVARFRTWVRAVPPGQTAPTFNPDRVLFRAPDGTYRVLESEKPLDDAIEAFNRAKESFAAQPAAGGS